MKKTGFNYIDRMTKEERADYLQNYRAIWDFMPFDKRTEMLSKYYELITKKRQQNPFVNCIQMLAIKKLCMKY